MSYARTCCLLCGVSASVSNLAALDGKCKKNAEKCA
jgi:hypothetical protein